MTVKQTNRSHRVALVVALLLLTVALTTALVLAGEDPDSPKKVSSTPQNSSTSSAELLTRSQIC